MKKNQQKSKNYVYLLFYFDKNIQIIQMSFKWQSGRQCSKLKKPKLQLSGTERGKKQYREKNFPDKSVPKSDLSTDSSCTYDPSKTSSDCTQTTIFRLPVLTVIDNPHKNSDTIITEHVSFRSAREYEQKVQALIKKTNLSQSKKVYLRLIIVDRQAQKDQRLQGYFEWALQKYRQLKQLDLKLQEKLVQ